jgi:DNA polymerase/3'-5' exonuclease PolX
MSLAAATLVARSVEEALRPACERILIAGSIRRLKPTVGDIEIVVLPKMIDGIRTDLFAPPPKVRALDGFLETLKLQDRLVAHPTKAADGDRYKRLWMPKEEMQLDLFIVRPPAEWGPIAAIRTGSAAYSKKAVTELRDQGLECKEGRIMRGNEVVPCPTEEEFFRLAGIPFLTPADRT